MLIKNKKATFNYEILEKYIAGIELFGFEVKSLKNKKGSFEGSFITFSPNKKGKLEAYLKNFFLPPYQEKNTPDSYDPQRLRKLLLTRIEIEKLYEKIKQKKLTIIPIKFFVKGSLIKLEIALAKGKKKADKRESIKKRDLQRQLQREEKIKLK